MTSSLTVLLLALLPAQEAGHAALHPAGAELFVELPDARALAEAYDAAPLVRMTRDDAVRAFLAKLSVDPAGAIRRLGEKLLPGRDVAALVAGVHAVSLSASLGEDPAGADLAFQLVLDLASAELAHGVERELLELAGAPAPAESPTAFVLASPGGPEVACWSLVDGSRLIVGGGATSAQGYAARSAGDETGWSSSPLARLAAGRPAAGGAGAAEQGPVVVRVQQTRSPFDVLPRVLGLLAQDPEDVPTLPLLFDPFAGPSVLEMRLVGERFVTEVLAPGPASGSPWVGRALAPADLDALPAGVMAIGALSYDLASLADDVRGWLGAPPGTNGEDAPAAELEALLRGLGPGLFAYAFPPSGIGLPPTYLTIDVADPAVLRELLDGASESLPRLFPGCRAETRDYRPRNAATGERERVPITTVELPPGLLELGPLVEIAPSLALVGDRLLVGTSSMSLKRELKRRFEEPSTQTSALPAGAHTLLWMDWGALVEGALGLVRSLGPLLGELGDLPFDPQALPEARIFTRYLRPTVHAVRPVEGGILHRHEASFGPETWLGLAALAVDLFGSGGRFGSSPEPGGPVQPPDPAPDPAEVTAARLDDLRTALAVFRIAEGSLPASLEQLVHPTSDYPQGFLEGTSVPADGWGHPFHYERSDEGYALRSLGPDGLDQGGGGDDLAAAD